MRTQLDVLKARLEAEPDGDESITYLIEEIDLIVETFTPIEESLYQTQNERRQDPLNYPIRLNNKLTSLMRTAAVGATRPTDSVIAVREEIGAAIESELELLDVVWEENVPALNSQIQSMGIDLVSIPDE